MQNIEYVSQEEFDRLVAGIEQRGKARASLLAKKAKLRSGEAGAMTLRQKLEYLKDSA